VPFCNRDQLETYIIQAVQDKVLPLRLNHITQSLHFGVNPFAYRESGVDGGPKLQSMQTDTMNRQLTTLSRRLHEAVAMIEPAAQGERAQQRRAALMENINKKIANEHMAILQRRRTIEARKETLEAQQNQRQRKEMENQQRVCKLPTLWF
jgi:septal ring factor EnvC (AmiA/AmiB activator)